MNRLREEGEDGNTVCVCSEVEKGDEVRLTKKRGERDTQWRETNEREERDGFDSRREEGGRGGFN